MSWCILHVSITTSANIRTGCGWDTDHPPGRTSSWNLLKTSHLSSDLSDQTDRTICITSMCMPLIRQSCPAGWLTSVSVGWVFSFRFFRTTPAGTHSQIKKPIEQRGFKKKTSFLVRRIFCFGQVHFVLERIWSQLFCLDQIKCINNRTDWFLFFSFNYPSLSCPLSLLPSLTFTLSWLAGIFGLSLSLSLTISLFPLCAHRSKPRRFKQNTIRSARSEMYRSVNLCRCALPSAVLRSSTGIRVDNVVCRHPRLHEYDLYFTLPVGMCTETSGFRIQGISISNNKKQTNSLATCVYPPTAIGNGHRPPEDGRQTGICFLSSSFFSLCSLGLSFQIIWTDLEKQLDRTGKGHVFWVLPPFEISPFHPLFTCFIWCSIIWSAINFSILLSWFCACLHMDSQSPVTLFSHDEATQSQEDSAYGSLLEPSFPLVLLLVTLASSFYSIWFG